MKKLFLMSMIVMIIFTSCYSQPEGISKRTTSEGISKESGNTTVQTTVAKNTIATTTANSKTISFPKNHVVDTPTYNKITTEIDKALVGKYVNLENEDAYFEIHEDGTFYCQFPYHTGGFETGDSDSLLLLVYYRENAIDLSFVSINGDIFLDYGIAINFYSSTTQIKKFYSLDNTIGVYIQQK